VLEVEHEPDPTTKLLSKPKPELESYSTSTIFQIFSGKQYIFKTIRGKL